MGYKNNINIECTCDSLNVFEMKQRFDCVAYNFDNCRIGIGEKIVQCLKRDTAQMIACTLKGGKLIRKYVYYCLCI